MLIAAVAVAACKPAQPSAEYLAACDGPWLRTAEQRNKAFESGHEIHPRFECATRQSVKAMAEQKAQWEAANTPEAKAARQAELDRTNAENMARIEAKARDDANARAERERRWAAAEAAPIERVDINRATDVQLSGVQGLDANVVHQIMAERSKAAFNSWDDLVRRVVGLGPAEAAARASAFGLTVNGRSLEGAEPESATARFVRDKWRRRSG